MAVMGTACNAHRAVRGCFDASLGAWCIAYTDKRAHLLLMLVNKNVVNLIKLLRWVEGQREDVVALSHSPLLLHTGMAGAAHS